MRGTTSISESPALLVEQLLDAMERLPAQGNAALRVMWLADDPDTPLADLVSGVESDPALVARVLHLANSAYAGSRQPIASVDRAVVWLGFSTVRTVAAVVACGLNGSVPTGFWSHAAATATAAQLVAWRFGIDPGEAFAIGLLHDLGRGIFHIADPAGSIAIDRRLEQERHEAVAALAASSGHHIVDRLVLERARFGMTHAAAAARVLGAWKLPASIVDAVGAHHCPLDPAAGDSVRLLMAAEALTALAVGAWGEPVDTEAGVGLLDLDHDRLDVIVRRIRNESTGLAAVLSL